MNQRQIFLVIALVSAAIFGLSVVAEKIWDITPCKLCLLQRGCHGLIILGSLLGAALKPLWKATKVALVAALLINGFTAAYHVGVQEGFFEYRCAVPNVNSKADFLRTLSYQNPCSKKWMIAGSSATMWNLAISVILLLILTSYPNRNLNLLSFEKFEVHTVKQPRDKLNV